MDDARRCDDDADRELLRVLDGFLDRVRDEAPFAADSLAAARERLADAIGAGADGRSEAGRVVRDLLGMYGGMGSVNDFPWSSDADAAKEALYESLVAAHGRIDAERFGPRHDPTSFPEVVVGSRVRLIAGAIRFVDARDGRRVPVEASDASDGVEWEVLAAHPADATGMPVYVLRRGDRHMSARVEAFEVVAPPE